MKDFGHQSEPAEEAAHGRGEELLVLAALRFARKLGAAWWGSLVLLASLVVIAGFEARPLIHRLQPSRPSMRNAAGQYRYEGKVVEVVEGVLALDGRATWADPLFRQKGTVRFCLLLVGAALLARSRGRIHDSLGLRWGSMLWAGALLGLTWEVATDSAGWHGPHWDEILLFRSPVSPYRDGFSNPYSVADVYLVLAFILIAVSLVPTAVRKILGSVARA